MSRPCNGPLEFTRSCPSSTALSGRHISTTATSPVFCSVTASDLATFNQSRVRCAVSTQGEDESGWLGSPTSSASTSSRYEPDLSQDWAPGKFGGARAGDAAAG